MKVRIVCNCGQEFSVPGLESMTMCPKCDRIYTISIKIEFGDGHTEATMVYIPGKNGSKEAFRCINCGANVFTARGMFYQCNGCDTEYMGNKK